MKTLFLEQSYKDVNNYLKDNIFFQKYDAWDYIVITASNSCQAKNYELQIENKLINKSIDCRSKYIVIPDLDDLRIGSGGATLNVLRELKIKHNVDFNKSKILLIHSGGDSKRIPQYSACGKLFSPIPRELSSSCGATLFDELIAITSLIPSRIKNGLMVMSGDAVLLFNPLQVELKDSDVYAVTIKKDVEVGKNHGVYYSDEDNNTLQFLHKKNANELKSLGAVDNNNQVNIDTGIIFFSGHVVNKLISLIAKNDILDNQLIKQYINDKIRLSLYGDFIYPMAKHAVYEDYLNEPAEGIYCQELLDCRKKIWQVINGIVIKVVTVSPAEFLHFGTTKEMLELVTKNIKTFEYLGWKKNVASNVVDAKYSSYNSAIVSSNINTNCYIENSYISASTIDSNTIISNLEVANKVLPSNIVLSGLKLSNGKYVVRIYGNDDNPKKSLKDSYLLKGNYDSLNKYFPLELDLDSSLWSADIYPTCDTMETALDYALKTYEMFSNCNFTFINQWKKCVKKSLESSYNQVDINWLLEWDVYIKNKTNELKLINELNSNKNLTDIIEEIGVETIRPYLEQLLTRIESFDNRLLRRIYMMSHIIEENSHKKNIYLDKIFQNIKVETLNNTMVKICKPIVQNNVEVRLPARVNFAGGWTDTPPYCLDKGGTVLNAAITIDGELPIIANVEILKERKFTLESKDMKVKKDIVTKTEMLNCSDPFDRVVLQKAAIVAMGIVDENSKENLSDVFDMLGGGLKLTTNVINIPKGSGLGTSSILASACVQALNKALGYSIDLNEMSSRVMMMEQLMSTGGGWQDQIGGAMKGIKLINSNHGIQNLNINPIALEDSTVKELAERFALIYTGQRRLARNLLREITLNYIIGKEKTLQALDDIENIALIMTRKLQRGDIDSFAKLMNQHWEYSKALDNGTTNTCIDYIFESCKDLIDGKMICGAGGGGFLQVLLKKGYTKKDLQDRLKEIFVDTSISVYNSEFVF